MGYNLFFAGYLFEQIILVAVLIYSYCLVKYGSRFSDVERMNILLLVSSVAAIGQALGIWYTFSHCS